MIPLHQDDDSPSSDLVQERYLQRVIDAQHTAALPNTPLVLVLSNRKAASVPQPRRHPSRWHTLPLQPCLSHNPGKTREDYDLELARIVLQAKLDLVVLTGWMHITRVKDRAKRTVAMMRLRQPFNGGYGAFQRREVDRLGVMVHRVVAEVDRGEPLIVREVPIEKDVSIEVYEERLHRVEWAIIVQATRKVPDKVRPLPPEGIDLA